MGLGLFTVSLNMVYLNQSRGFSIAVAFINRIYSSLKLSARTASEICSKMLTLKLYNQCFTASVVLFPKLRFA